MVLPSPVLLLPCLGVDLSLTFGQVQGASFRGWKEVTSLFSNEDEQHLLGRCRSPKSRG